MTLLLVMLHTGTMFAVIVYFWRQWRRTYFSSMEAFKRSALLVVTATVLTGIIGEVLMKIIEKMVLRNVPHAQIEDLFGHLEWVAPALFVAGVLILIAGMRERLTERRDVTDEPELSMRQASWVGAVQGLCLPFRGFSRSGATISTGMLAGAARARVESFSFALAVVLTPPAIAKEALRLAQDRNLPGAESLGAATAPSLLGAVFAFLAGLVALKWLSGWLENGRWYLFGIYCLVASGLVFYLHHIG